MAEMLEVVDILDNDEASVLPENSVTKHKTLNIPVAQVIVPEYAAGDPVTKDFVSSVRTGLQYPIRVKETDEGYFLLDGWRRLQAYKEIGGKTIPALVESRETTPLQDIVLGLTANYSRSENFMGSARRIWEALDQGATEKGLVNPSIGLKLAKVRQLRDMRKLRPELIEAAENGLMSSWSAGMAARLDDEQQEFLVEQLEENGKVIKDDIEEARRVGRQQAAASLPESMFDVPDLDGDDEDEDVAAEVDQMNDLSDAMVAQFASESENLAPQSDETYEKVLESVSDEKGKVSRKGRYALVSSRLNAAKGEMVKIKAPRKPEEAAILDGINDLLDQLAELSEGE